MDLYMDSVSVYRKIMLLISILFITSCSDDQLGYEDNIKRTILQPVNLVGNQWGVCRIFGSQGTYYISPPFENIFEFFEDGRLCIYTLTNTFNYSYVISGVNIRAELLTDAAANSDMSELLKNAGEQLKSFEISNDTLYLYSDYAPAAKLALYKAERE